MLFFYTLYNVIRSLSITLEKENPLQPIFARTVVYPHTRRDDVNLRYKRKGAIKEKKGEKSDNEWK